MIRTDFHIHTLYCDGIDAPEEMISEAVKKGFTCIGFSGHSYTEFDLSYCMTPEKMEKYYNEIMLLKKKYSGKIDILCGLEQDLYSQAPCIQPDYLIGSVHYIKINENYYPIDESAEYEKKLVNEFFKGSFDAFAEHYYNEVSELIKKQNPQIIGHFDLITKFEKQYPIVKGERYYNSAKGALDILLKSGALFEVNTGAIAKGYKDLPYPDEILLKHIRKNGGKVILSSDCHDKNMLGLGFDDALNILKKCGFDDESIKKYPVNPLK